MQRRFHSRQIIKSYFQSQLPARQVRRVRQQAIHCCVLTVKQCDLKALLFAGPVHAVDFNGQFQRRPACEIVFPGNHMQKVRMCQLTQVTARRAYGQPAALCEAA